MQALGNQAGGPIADSAVGADSGAEGASYSGPSGHDSKAPRRFNVLLGVSGSVAAIKTQELSQKLAVIANLRVVATKTAMHFVEVDGVTITEDEDEWHAWELGSPVEHIELRRWADLFVIAPLSANTLAKMAQGLCDNLLTCIVRAWDYQRPLLVAPAMNTLMWENPFTKEHLGKLESALKVVIIPPVVKTLACGDIGVGAMAHVDDIVKTVQHQLAQLGLMESILPT